MKSEVEKILKRCSGCNKNKIKYNMVLICDSYIYSGLYKKFDCPCFDCIIKSTCNDECEKFYEFLDNVNSKGKKCL